MYSFEPTVPYRYAFKKGMTGTEIAALQLNLSKTVVDGVFGPETKKAVQEVQRNNVLMADGVAGPATMRVICLQKSRKATRDQSLPPGLLPSIMLKESNFNVAAVSNHPSDPGMDIGAYQRSTGNIRISGPSEFLQAAYTVAEAAEVSAASIRRVHNSQPPDPVFSKYFLNMAEEDVDRFRWQMAVLNHNWPYAAYNIPRRGSIFVNAQDDDDAQDWVIKASGGRLRTARQWAMDYVERGTVLVEW